jgi:hypothetical protein
MKSTPRSEWKMSDIIDAYSDTDAYLASGGKLLELPAYDQSVLHILAAIGGEKFRHGIRRWTRFLIALQNEHGVKPHMKIGKVVNEERAIELWHSTALRHMANDQTT